MHIPSEHYSGRFPGKSTVWVVVGYIRMGDRDRDTRELSYLRYATIG